MSNVLIGRDEAFGMQLAEWDMQGPLLVAHSAQTIHCQIDTLADADPGGASEQQCLSGQVIAAMEFLLEALILFGRKSSRQAAWLWREILAANESRLEVMAVVGEVF